MDTGKKLWDLLTWSRKIFNMPNLEGGQKGEVMAGRGKEVFVPKLCLSELQKDFYVLSFCVHLYKIYINIPAGFNSILFITRSSITIPRCIFNFFVGSCLAWIWCSEISLCVGCRPGENWTATKPWKWRHLQTGLWDHWPVLLLRWCECAVPCSLFLFTNNCFHYKSAAGGGSSPRAALWHLRNEPWCEPPAPPAIAAAEASKEDLRPNLSLISRD